jgi:hypothetical protein
MIFPREVDWLSASLSIGESPVIVKWKLKYWSGSPDSEPRTPNPRLQIEGVQQQAGNKQIHYQYDYRRLHERGNRRAAHSFGAALDA